MRLLIPLEPGLAAGNGRYKDSSKSRARWTVDAEQLPTALYTRAGLIHLDKFRGGCDSKTAERYGQAQFLTLGAERLGVLVAICELWSRGQRIECLLPVLILSRLL